MSKILNEENRNQLINGSKNGTPKAKQRYKRRLKSRVANSVREFNSIDMNKLFKEDILTINIKVQGETDNYLVRISFGGFCRILQDEIKRSGNEEVDLRNIIRALMLGFNRDDVFIRCNCLHEDTIIPLLDGTFPTIKEVCDRYNSGEELWAYSVDGNGDFKPGKIEKAWKTGSSNLLVEVELDNGEVVRSTPEHLFMLRDGSYTMSQDLKVGQSLMPLYFSETTNGYDTVKFNSTGKYHSVYKVVASECKQDEILLAESRSTDSDNMAYKVAIHHRNLNKKDNSPSNLLPMTAREHFDLHNKILTELWNREDFRDRQSKKATEHIKKLNENPTENMKKSRKEWQEKGRLRNYDEDRRQQQSLIAKTVLKSYWDNLPDDEYYEKKHKHASEEQKLKQSVSLKNVWDSYTEEQRKSRISKIVEENRTEDRRKKSSETLKHTREKMKESLGEEGYHEYYSKIQKDSWENNRSARATDKFWEARKNAFQYERTPEVETARKRTKIYNVIKRILEAGEIPSPETYEKFRTAGYPKYTSAFSSWEELSQFYKLNHAVASVKIISVPDVDVYDLKISEYENFLVGAGVIVHNCPDATFRMNFWQSKKNIIAGDPETIPSDITNPNDTLGTACKHVLLVLTNTTWVIKTGSVINNYIHYMEKHYKRLYADIIYPAIYGKKYEEPVQLRIDEPEELDTGEETIDIANKERVQDTRFKKGNAQGIRFSKKDDSVQDQIGIEDEEEVEEET